MVLIASLEQAPTIGLKARPIAAWGDAPGTWVGSSEGLKTRSMPFSCPDMLLVPIDAISLQKLPELVFERLLRVMLPLRVDQRFLKWASSGQLKGVECCIPL